MTSKERNSKKGGHMPSLENSLTIMKYKETLKKYVGLYYDRIDESELDKIIDYSISKRYQSNKAEIDNNYTKEVFDTTLLGITDYILENRPVVTSFGTMFMNHITCPNPMANVVKSFMDLRNVHKKEMFKFPKGSANFEKFNLLQSLTKMSRDLG